MRVALAEAGVAAEWHDIWADPDARAFVRSVAAGNETVPTVQIGAKVLVAPRPRQVIEEIQAIAPELAVSTRRWPPLRLVQWATIAGLLLLSAVLSRSGDVTLSWAAYGAAVLSYVALRHLRSRPRGRPAPPPR